MANPKKNKPSPASYQQRSYRALVDTDGLFSFHVFLRESDLHILAKSNLRRQAYHLVMQYRNQLENYIVRNPKFLTALVPLEVDITAPPIVKEMLAAGTAAGVGPMAAVAGAMAEFVGKDLLPHSLNEIMVENGGDIFLKRAASCRVAIFAGQSIISKKIGINITVDQMPLGICTSSGTVGHSLSFGLADAVTVVAPSTSLADAAATRLANETKGERPISEVLEVAEAIKGITGVVVVRGEELGAWGEVELVEL